LATAAGAVELEVDAPLAPAAIVCPFLADFFAFCFFTAGAGLSAFLFFGSGGELLLESSSRSLRFAV